AFHHTRRLSGPLEVFLRHQAQGWGHRPDLAVSWIRAAQRKGIRVVFMDGVEARMRYTDDEFGRRLPVPVSLSNRAAMMNIWANAIITRHQARNGGKYVIVTGRQHAYTSVTGTRIVAGLAHLLKLPALRADVPLTLLQKVGHVVGAIAKW